MVVVAVAVQSPKRGWKAFAQKYGKIKFNLIIGAQRATTSEIKKKNSIGKIYNKIHW